MTLTSTRVSIPGMRAGGSDTPLLLTGSFDDLRQLIVPVHELVAKTPSPQFRFDVERLRPLRDAVQRDMKGAKLTNAKRELPLYIREKLLSSGIWEGPVWTATVWVETKLESAPDGTPGTPRWLVNPAEKGFILDAESRAYALEEIFIGARDPKEREHVLNVPLNIVLYDGIAIERAAQHFRDINGLGVGINSSILLSHDYADPWMEVTRKVFAELGLDLEEQSRQVSTKSPAVMTVVQARTMVSAIFHDITAVGFGAGRIPRTTGQGDQKQEVDFDRLRGAAEQWLARVFKEHPPEGFKDKKLILGSAPVIASLGALGRPFYTGDRPGQEKASEIIQSDEIDWSRGEHWAGVAGKLNPEGQFSVASGKESGHATFRALKDRESEGYLRIRRGQGGQAAN